MAEQLTVNQLVVGSSPTLRAMKISIFTPSHDPKFLNDAEDSVLRQTYEDWEWIVLLNGGATWTSQSGDKRIKVMHVASANGVGDAKYAACRMATGEILVELDHDDILVSTALEELVTAFTEHPNAVFVYSNTAQINEDRSRNQDLFAGEIGWTYSEARVDGYEVLECHAMEPYPSSVSYIWFAPNHVRAFRTDAYNAVGGYNQDLDVLDDQDLMNRLYQYGDFYHIDKCLYLQRIHTDNTQKVPDLNARIQEETVVLYDQNVEANALAWAKRNNLFALDLGAAHGKPEGYIGIDLHDADWNGDVFEVMYGLEDSSVGVIRAYDFLEHIPDKVAMFNEMYRVLAHGGMILSMTPSTDGRGAYQDPTHVAFYNENSFWYYTSAQFANYVPEIQCRFQISKIETTYPSEWHQQHDISYVKANLVAIKHGPRIAGILFE